MASLELERVSKWFGPRATARRVLDEVSLAVADGEFLVLLGPSGCGKSTLLRIVAGLEAADAGDVRLDGARVNELEPRARDVAMVFQNYALYPHMRVRQNLAFPLRMAGVERKAAARKVDEVARLLGLSAELDRRPGTLSGGQMQRVALGRAIVRDPRLFLFDEPLSNLDAQLRTEMRGEIARLHATLGITSLYVTHDQVEAMTMGSRICVLEGGRVQQIGTPMEVFERPANRFVAGFLGSPPMNLLRGRVVEGRFQVGALALASAPGCEGEEFDLGIRPHAVGLDGEIPFEVERMERLGSHALLFGRLGDAPFLVAREGDPAMAVGERLGLSFPPSRLHWFDAREGRRLAPIS